MPFFPATRGHKNNKEWRHNIPINLGLEHFHKVDLSLWSWKPPGGGQHALVLMLCRLKERHQNWTQKIRSYISLPLHVVFKFRVLKNHQVSQIHEVTLRPGVFQIAHHGYRHLHLFSGFLPFYSCFHAFHSNTVTNSK